VAELSRQYKIVRFVLGDRTAACRFRARLEQLIAVTEQLHGVPITMVDEHMSSVEGRRAYLLAHRQGWRRLVPLGLLWTNEPFDHYVAEVLVRRYLTHQVSDFKSGRVN